VSAGTYTITEETQPDGWETSWAITAGGTGSGEGNSATVTVQSGDTITITFTNTYTAPPCVRNIHVTFKFKINSGEFLGQSDNANWNDGVPTPLDKGSTIGNDYFKITITDSGGNLVRYPDNTPVELKVNKADGQYTHVYQGSKLVGYVFSFNKQGQHLECQIAFLDVPAGAGYKYEVEHYVGTTLKDSVGGPVVGQPCPGSGS
jgi:hypothetical protein